MFKGRTGLLSLGVTLNIVYESCQPPCLFVFPDDQYQQTNISVHQPITGRVNKSSPPLQRARARTHTHVQTHAIERSCNTKGIMLMYSHPMLICMYQYLILKWVRWPSKKTKTKNKSKSEYNSYSQSSGIHVQHWVLARALGEFGEATAFAQRLFHRRDDLPWTCLTSQLHDAYTYHISEAQNK